MKRAIHVIVFKHLALTSNMPFGLRLKKTRRYNVSGKNSFVARIQLLDSASLEITLTPESLGQDCLDTIAQKLPLEEVSSLSWSFERILYGYFCGGFIFANFTCQSWRKISTSVYKLTGNITKITKLSNREYLHVLYVPNPKLQFKYLYTKYMAYTVVWWAL